uniref:Uncharacterized protein n=1 Tax=Timema shepardi TaxID=629360 RepID=A0A7R9G6D7_TIMSH|nr:unnamed protein product [Timema shepardi]
MMAIEVQLREMGGALPDATGSAIPDVWDELDLIYQLISTRNEQQTSVQSCIRQFRELLQSRGLAESSQLGPGCYSISKVSVIEISVIGDTRILAILAILELRS